ncbi:MAG: aminotransferase class III-fold pyridoxal phosphate-dependent enzyme [Ferrovibrio sp.]
MIRNNRYSASQSLLERAQRVIPLGTQTFSKSYQQFPEGSAPLFLTHGKGSHVWDADGNEYIDMISGLLPVVLGYQDADVDNAIREQLQRGISFSLATELEVEVAELLTEIVPCAEMVRFGKNGSDATTGCVRVARAATGRDRLVICGYHGWHDWYIGSTVRNKGVPAAIGAMVDRVPYNDMDALHQIFSRHPGEIAAIIMEPMNSAEPKPGYLEEVKEFAHSQGALLIFDEIITGFRFALGGAQEHFGVTPDLAAFGKAMGNGMPIAAVVGRADLMSEMEEIFFSSTFGGEALSLAAAKALILKMRREPVIETLWARGSALADGVRKLIQKHELSGAIGLYGLAPWTLLGFYDMPNARKEAIKTLFIREMLAGGILMAASHNMSYAHSDQDVAALLAAYDRTLGTIVAEMATGKLEQNLECPAIMPVFSVRQV